MTQVLDGSYGYDAALAGNDSRALAIAASFSNCSNR